MRILYVTTTFPVYSETFLQREVRALKSLGADLRILSLHRGEVEFDGLAIDRFKKRELLQLIWLLPWKTVFHRKQLGAHWRELFARRPASWLNFWENLLGLGAAIAREKAIREIRPDIVHCVWSSAPAAFGWLASSLIAKPFSIGAHAYDVFEKGGDWLLPIKARQASFIHTSTNSTAIALSKIVSKSKIHVIRRGLNAFPEFKLLRADRKKLRLICVARLVEKKGFPYQLDIYEALTGEDLDFEAEIVGDGPLESYLHKEIESRNLVDRVRLSGRLSSEETMKRIAWADALIHTGVVAADGDRDGLPNVIPEAMASGTLVIASPVSGVVEAVTDEETGFLREVGDPPNWVETCQRIQADDALCERLRNSARSWVEREFSASQNSGRLLRLLSAAGERRI